MLGGRGALVAPTFLINDLLLRGDVAEPWPGLRIPGPVYTVVVDRSSPEIDAAETFASWLVDLTAGADRDRHAAAPHQTNAPEILRDRRRQARPVPLRRPRFRRQSV